jgi:acyl-coenzyme A synthetase/AMP-(fatty) acid ligase
LYVFDLNQNGIPGWSKNFDSVLEEASAEPLSGGQRSCSSDKMLYIYTSGTTGLPKAAVIRNSRYTCGESNWRKLITVFDWLLQLLLLQYGHALHDQHGGG